MKKIKLKFPSGRYILIVTLLLVLTAIYAAIRLMQVDIPEEPVRVSVVTENSGSEREHLYFQGIEQAAADEDVLISTVMTSYYKDAGEEETIVTGEYLGGANVVIKKNRPDAKEVSELLMQELSTQYGGVLTGRNVALLLGGEYDTFSSEVGSLLSAKITEAGGEILWEKNAPCNVNSLLKKSIRPDIIVAIDDDSLTQAAAYLSSKKSDRRCLVGMGCSPSAVYYLDRGVISAMVVPDDFTLGYESLMAAVNGGNVSDLATELTLIHPEEVHEKENEKLLFP